MDFDEVGRNVKDLMKNKKFQVACIVVAIIAIILWIIKESRKATTTTTTTETFDYYDGVSPIGYGGYGYPFTGDGSSEDFDWLYERLDGIADKIEEGNLAQDEKWQGMFDSINDRLDDMADKDEAGGSGGSDFGGFVGGGSSSSKVNEQAIIDAMEQNSNAWWDVTDAAGRDYLHAENQYLAQQIGASYDSQTGLWYKDGMPLYNVNKGNAMSYVTTTGDRNPSSGNVEYVANIDYQAAINEAIMTGQSASVIDQLNEARNKKIAATGIGSTVSFDPNTDYQALINKARETGASQEVINNLTASRNAKIAAANDGTTPTSAASGSPKRVNMIK